VSELIIYQNDQSQAQVSVRLEGETVWLTQEQMAQLFGRERSVITKHLRNVFKEGELAEETVCAKYAHTAQDGKSYQTMFGNPLYRSREEKAAHLLYFIIKDHPFLDGNKRIGSFLFLLYQRQEGMPATITENTLTALALLIAQSDPGVKDLMIRLVVNLLTTE
jgi:prophage maintenance system killer protein